MKMKKLLVAIVIGVVAFAAWRVSRTKDVTKVVSKTVTSITTTKPSSEFDMHRYSIDKPGSLWWIVNKKRPLPEGYAPSDLVVPNVALRLSSNAEQMHLSKVTADALPALFDAAQMAGYPLELASGYRSEAYQRQLYNGYVNKDGQAAADQYSAKPGTSEHQTGLAMDVCAKNSSCALEQSFGKTATGEWLAAHAYEYGFVVRYLDGKQNITGYEYEPWHIRYIGTDLANQLQSKNQTI